MKLYCHKVVADSIAKNYNLTDVLKTVKSYFNSEKDAGTFRYNSFGAVYIAPDDDLAKGASIDYIQKQLNKLDDDDLTDILESDPYDFVDLLDEYETNYRTGSYTDDKYAMLAQLNMVHSKQADNFYTKNWDILEEVYTIACNYNDISVELPSWSDGTPNLEIAIKKMVQIKGDHVIFKGIPYEGLAGLIMAYYYGESYINKSDHDYNEKLRILESVISKIQEYLSSIEISSQYNYRSRALIADKSDFD